MMATLTVLRIQVGVASRWHTDGIAGHKLVATEESYDLYRVGSLLFFSGLSSWSFLHGKIVIMITIRKPIAIFSGFTTLITTRNLANSFTEI
jgi:hypothetical protein